MYALNYVRPKSIKEAADFLASHPEAKLISGGMTLIPTLKQRLAKPTHLVDIAHRAELGKIEVKAGKRVVGAGARHHAVATSAVVKKAIRALAARAAYSKFHHPASGYAMAGVFIAQTAEGVRVAVTGAGPGVFRWKEAEAALAKSLKPAALEGVKLDSSSFNNDMHADRAYRANLVRVMAKRALAKLSGKK